MPIVGFILRQCKLYYKKKEWRKLNSHNFTSIDNLFSFEKVKVGKYTYGSFKVFTYGNPAESLQIGSFCSIAKNVVFIMGGEHNYKTLSTYPFMKKFGPDCSYEAITKGPIIVEDDVWIGYGVTILSGVRIGQGVVIGAGSVVSKDVPPYAVYANNSVIKYRFPEEIRNELMKIDFSLIDKEEVLANIQDYYVQCSSVEDIKKLSWYKYARPE